MKLKKISLILPMCLAFSISCNRDVTKADTQGTSEKGVVIKSTSLSTNKVIKVPQKGGTSSQNYVSNSYGSIPLSRGASEVSGSLVNFAYRQLGKPYVWGAIGPRSFDCSGLTMYVYGAMGVSLPHYSGDQFGMGSPVSKGNLQPGDLVFFNTYGSISHVGIYVGGGEFIHAPGSGRGVTVSDLNSGYYAQRYAGARRIFK